jgi:hypothetical protein
MYYVINTELKEFVPDQSLMHTTYVSYIRECERAFPYEKPILELRAYVPKGGNRCKNEPLDRPWFSCLSLERLTADQLQKLSAFMIA